MIVVPICRGKGDLDVIYFFNKLGMQLWLLLEESRSAQELADWVTDHYDVAVEQALADVVAYLAELEDAGLVCKSSGG